MTPPHDVVFLLDVDNTLLDNDQIEHDLRRHLEQAFGVERHTRYWEIFEKLRTELGYADYLGALQRYRLECLRDPHLLETSFVPGGLPVFALAYSRSGRASLKAPNARQHCSSRRDDQPIGQAKCPIPKVPGPMDLAMTSRWPSERARCS